MVKLELEGPLGAAGAAGGGVAALPVAAFKNPPTAFGAIPATAFMPAPKSN